MANPITIEVTFEIDDLPDWAQSEPAIFTLAESDLSFRSAVFNADEQWQRKRIINRARWAIDGCIQVTQELTLHVIKDAARCRNCPRPASIALQWRGMYGHGDALCRDCALSSAEGMCEYAPSKERTATLGAINQYADRIEQAAGV